MIHDGIVTFVSHVDDDHMSSLFCASLYLLYVLVGLWTWLVTTRWSLVHVVRLGLARRRLAGFEF
jgi:hypothetical protein